MFKRTKQPTPIQMVLRVVYDIQARKRAARIEPDHALLIGDRIYLHVSQVLTPEGFKRIVDKLVADGIILRGDTARDTYIRIADYDSVASRYNDAPRPQSPQLTFNER
ncbi:hypothetical protein [Alistipes onderdonkii]|uniref:hypothetical protein n=1 Tax=Alistipes onderdonkii TaxID=328813 RepID=UPI00050A11D3|nr:hypothetical protein [Alistipes onderdonkii]MBD9237942.1 hypothetical protein [Alistipes onderdonkii]